YRVRFGGRVAVDADGRRSWVDTDDVMAMAVDVPVPGYQNEVVNTLRLWSAKATSEFDISAFAKGDYVEAVYAKTASENLGRVLYPNDAVATRRELRLQQEYFFVSATIQDAIRRHRTSHPSVADLAEHAVFQLNDTHPAIGIAELMRVLLDEHDLGWDEAWTITASAFAYTNHTVMPEALEQWPVALF